MKASKRASLWTPFLAVMLLASGGCDFGDPVDHSTGGGTSVDGLTGNLVVTGGAPAAGAMVRVFSASSSSGTLAKSSGASETSVTSETSALDSVQANSAGRFQFKDLPDGTYNLSALLRLSDNTVLALYLPGIVVDGKTSIGVDTLQLTGTLVLQVRGSGNAKISGALCVIAGGAWQVSSDSTGTCTLTEIPPGVFRATITHPSYQTAISADVTVTSGTSTSGGVVILISTANPLFPAPTLTSPAANATGVSITGPLSWTPPSVQNPLGYRVQVATDSGFSQVVRDTVVANPGVSLAYAPLAPNTVYYWRANATIGSGISTPSPGTTAWSSFRKFTTAAVVAPAAPTPLYPLSGAVNLPAIPGYIWSPAFTWSSVSGATGYHLEVVGSDNLAVPLANDSTLTDTSRVAGPLKELVTYGWRVRARNAAGWGPWSATITVTRGETSTPTLAAPELATPVANAIGVGSPISLAWNQVSGATHYHIQVSRTESFETHALNDSMLTATSRLFSNTEFSTRYYWRARARSATGTSGWSEVRTFTTQPFVDVILLSPPILSTPPDSAMFVDPMPTLTWGAVTGAVGYQLQLSTSADFTSLIVNDSALAATSRTVGPLVLGTKYFWRVRGTPGDVGVWSAVRSFTTAAASGAATWTTRNSGTTAALRAVTWTGTQYVAVGDGGTIRTSPNGINWTARSSGTTEDLYAVTWTGSLLVAGGDETNGQARVIFRTSPDGIVWTARVPDGTVGINKVRSIQWTGGQLLAGGTQGGYWSSTDGVTWKGGEYIFTSAIWMSGAIAGNISVMVSGPSMPNATGEVAVSTTGSYDWESHATGTKTLGTGMETYGGLSSVASTGSLFVGVVGIATAGTKAIPPGTITNFGTIMTSTNGTTWTTRATATGMRYVIWTGTRLAAMAADGATMTSTDGISWSPDLPSSGATSLNAFVRGNAWVAVGANGSIVTAP